MSQGLLQRLEECLLYSFSSEAELFSSIEELIDVFNFQRDKISSYGLDERLVGAYVMYFLSSNLGKWQRCLDFLSKEEQASISQTTLIDFGTGPGTYVFSALESKHLGAIWGIDHSGLMLDQARKISESFGYQKQVQFSKSLPQKIEGECTLLFSHSANEMNKESILKKIDQVDPEYLIFLEPGTKQSFQKLKDLRENLLENYSILYPCLASNICPLNEDDWCHQVIQIRQPPDVQRLCQKLKRDRNKMAICFQVYSKKKDKFLSENQARLINRRPKQKMGYRWDICKNSDGNNQFSTLDILKKDQSKEVFKSLKRTEQGDLLEFEDLSSKRAVLKS